MMNTEGIMPWSPMYASRNLKYNSLSEKDNMELWSLGVQDEEQFCGLVISVKGRRKAGERK